MFCVKSKPSVELFYERWRSFVFNFCLLVTANELRAEESTVESFIEYARNQSDMAAAQLPPMLLRYALIATQRAFAPPPMTFRLKVFEHSIFLLPLQGRVAFAIHHVLGLPLSTVACVLQIAPEEARGLCCQALVRLRDTLPLHFFGRVG